MARRNERSERVRRRYPETDMYVDLVFPVQLIAETQRIHIVAKTWTPIQQLPRPISKKKIAPSSSKGHWCSELRQAGSGTAPTRPAPPTKMKAMS